MPCHEFGHVKRKELDLSPQLKGKTFLLNCFSYKQTMHLTLVPTVAQGFAEASFCTFRKGNASG